MLKLSLYQKNQLKHNFSQLLIRIMTYIESASEKVETIEMKHMKTPLIAQRFFIRTIAFATFFMCSLHFVFGVDLVSIDKILATPSAFENQPVNLKGLVTKFIPGDENAVDRYLIQSEFANTTISITTMSGKPEVFKVYEVTGTVVLDPYNGTPYVIEKGRDLVRDTSGFNHPLILFAFFVGFLILAVLVIVLLARTSKHHHTEMPVEMVTTRGNSAIDYNNDFKTIRIPSNTPKTLQFIPGKLIITAGEDKGKEFLISGYPTPKGNVVSVGREVVVGERMYSHIQLNDKTVSRRQAELIHKEDKLFLRNISETNYTSLDGKELGLQEVREVNKNAFIKMGDLEFQYTA